MADSLQSSKSRKGKEREPAQGDIFYDKLIAMQRSNFKASASRPRERSEKPSPRPVSPTLSPTRRPQQPTPQVFVHRPDSADVPDDSQRRRKQPSTAPRSHNLSAQSPKAQGKLFNPDVDPIPMRRTAEPESISDTASSSYAPRNILPSQDRGATHHGRLFDHKKDDPVRFHVLARPPPVSGNRQAPTPKSSGEYVSASSTSSYAHSITSSSFTLNSTTDGSSASSALFDQQPREHTTSSAFAQQLKKLYRSISNLETKLLREDGRDDEGRITLKRPNEATTEPEEAEKEKWRKFVADHKQLAESMHNLLQLTLAPHVPASLRNIPTKYNIIIRLWTHGFNKPLETLRRASFQSAIALEHLQEFIIYAYTFYSMLLEEQTLDGFKSGWLEALGDLARYRMAIAAMTAPSSAALTNAGDFVPVNQQALAAQTQSEESLARIDDSPGQSVGVAAARALEIEPEKERWRCIARDWYAAGLTDTPGTGKLHHHLGLLSRDIEKEELRSVYHFVKSMTTLHPFSTSRESVLPIWSVAAQSRRSTPDASVVDLFVLMHGMLFTNVQLDDFHPTLARFMERLRLEGAEEREWIMMAVVNIAAVLEYGKASGVLRSTGGIGSGGGSSKDVSTAAQAAAASARVNMLVKKVDEMEVDDNEGVMPPIAESRIDEEEMDVRSNGVLNVSPILVQRGAVPIDQAEHPLSFKFALQLAFQMFEYTLQTPFRTTAPFSRPSLNPYNTIMLTFLATVLKHPVVQRVLERAIPWDALAELFSTVPHSVLVQAEGGIRLTSGCAPMSEDWCLRGMEWGGRRVYERGFWKSGEDRHAEMEVLDAEEDKDNVTDGIIEDETDETEGRADLSETNKRWVRIARAASVITKVVSGFAWEAETRNFAVIGELREKVKAWKEEERMAREEEERRRSRRPWINDEMDVDEEEDHSSDELEADDEDDSEDIRILKARRHELLQLLKSAQQPRSQSPPKREPRVRRSRHQEISQQKSLRVVPGYTVLVVDTNILLSSLSIFASLVESLCWTILVPLAVITELDGISSNQSALGKAASDAITYISSHIRSHSLSLKVQTSKGNYLQNLGVRSEQVEFTDESWERSMDDLILRATIWQDDHWVDRSTILGAAEHNTVGAAKVVLLSFDRNLRLKARARQLDAADEKAMAAILKAGS